MVHKYKTAYEYQSYTTQYNTAYEYQAYTTYISKQKQQIIQSAHLSSRGGRVGDIPIPIPIPIQIAC